MATETLTIVTNHQYRNLTYGYELSEKERADFDHYIDFESDDGACHDFLRYRGNVYDVSEFEHSNVKGWDGQHCDTYFSGILIRFDPDDPDRIMVARFYS